MARFLVFTTIPAVFSVEAADADAAEALVLERAAADRVSPYTFRTKDLRVADVQETVEADQYLYPDEN